MLPSAPSSGDTILVQVQALDVRSILDRHQDIAMAVRKNLQHGGPLIQEMQRTINPR